MATQTLVTFDQFMDLPEQEGVDRELDEGRVIEMPHPSFLHGAIQGRVFHFFTVYLERTGADFHASLNTGFRLGPETVRAPDVCLVRRSSYAAMEAVKGALLGFPDLAVEIVSPSDTAADMDRKIEQYLRAGAAAVWVFYPETRHVMIRRRSGETRIVTSGQTLEEPELLPGLSILVDHVFSGIEELKK
ncbi:MAG: Uma2 family endonuclease [Acidobacteria bacterium]|nr:Uma2 family endonuclease [Acidobacteriota bacterium]